MATNTAVLRIESQIELANYMFTGMFMLSTRDPTMSWEDNEVIGRPYE